MTAASCPQPDCPDLVTEFGWRELCQGQWVFGTMGWGAQPQVRVYQGY